MYDRLTVAFIFFICSLLSDPAFAQRNSSVSQISLAGSNTTALVACIRHDINKRSGAATAQTSSLSLASSVELTCRSQMQELEHTARREQGGSFDQMAFEREWRAAIAVGAQQVLIGTPVHSLDLEEGLKNGQAHKEFERILQANVKAKRLAAQTCLHANINKHAGAVQETAEAVARLAIKTCKHDLDRLNHASCLHVTGNNCTIDLTRVNTLQMHINDWGSAVTAAVASARSPRPPAR